MNWPTPEPGLVIRYSYLWHREANRGQEEGVKDRPCAIILLVRQQDDNERVYVLPITHVPPTNEADGVLLPPAVKVRLGLDKTPSWVMVTETNNFLWPGPDLRIPEGKSVTEAAYGFLPPLLFDQIRDRFLQRLKKGRASIVGRTD